MKVGDIVFKKGSHCGIIEKKEHYNCLVKWFSICIYENRNEYTFIHQGKSLENEKNLKLFNCYSEPLKTVQLELMSSNI